MTKFSRTSTGKYSVAGKTYELLIGTRAQVWHGTAYKTTGGLTHSDLMKNKSGRIVSKAKHNTAKREKRLVKAGFYTKKGHFGFVKKTRGGAATAPTTTNNAALDAANAAIKNTLMARHPPSTTTSTTAKTGGRRSGTRRHRGGSNAYPLSPAHYDGKGVGTSGNAVQFAAGAGN